MSEPIEWTKDPVVILEKAVMPAMWLGYTLLASPPSAYHSRDSRFAAFDIATEMLRLEGPKMLNAAGVKCSFEAQTAFTRAATEIDSLHVNLRKHLIGASDRAGRNSLLEQITGSLHPAVETAVDAYRALFITFVQKKQRSHAHQAGEALRGLDRISKQIYFISINASIEAARVGDAGRGFLQISTDIRTLSKSARDATRDLSDLVMDRQRAV
ncbi:MAG: methyl-accepting chemotaxis protein [Sulfitobacter sp.]